VPPSKKTLKPRRPRTASTVQPVIKRRLTSEELARFEKSPGRLVTKGRG
jgi:hypothetical protein